MLDFQQDQQARPDSIDGGFVEIRGESYYRIANVHRMREFYMSLTSADDHWMFISSRGALSAGRQNPDQSLFPYYSADKISDLVESTGPKTIVQVQYQNGKLHTTNWEPFSGLPSSGSTRQNIYKSELGDRLIFEEFNDSLELRFQYSWEFSNEYGFVRSCQLENVGFEPRQVRILDGVQNLVPAGIDRDFQLRFSNLCDAYKKNELHPEGPIGIFYVSSIPSDRAMPCESLKATVAWQSGLENPIYLLSSSQIQNFREGLTVNSEFDVRGQRGAFLVCESASLAPAQIKPWQIVSDVEVDHATLTKLSRDLTSDKRVSMRVEQDVELGATTLRRMLGTADGIQVGSDRSRTARHLSNVKFNIMRGGVPIDEYRIPVEELGKRIQSCNAPVYERHREFLDQLPAITDLESLASEVDKIGCPDLIRLTRETIPLTFGRRHGDPTRPWNSFDIQVRNADGSPRIYYQGNWRDLFQNWEALGQSFPALLPRMISRFVNSMTADGYNPYRIDSDGIDWEVPDPKDPWANFGYWSDHQVIYLLKLIEHANAMMPGVLEPWLNQRSFSYANIPYRIHSFDSICQDPYATIDFDESLAETIEARVAAIGNDGKLVLRDDQTVLHVNLLEKMLVPTMAKMCNLVPGGGIWLNTQRPEWNDANNALVGRGLSMVTVCYLRRMFAYLRDWLGQTDFSSAELSIEVAEWLENLVSILDSETIDNANAKNNQVGEWVTRLGRCGSEYRAKLYADGLTGKTKSVDQAQVIRYFDLALKHIDSTIRQNRRADGLYHSYNLMDWKDDGVQISHLQEMLEGQVAVISSGLLNPDEVADVLDALRSSRMYRADVRSFTLYPDKELDRFVEKNRIPVELITELPLLQEKLGPQQSIVVQGPDGQFHFNANLRNVKDLADSVEKAKSQGLLVSMTDENFDQLKRAFVDVFDHGNFTGRSGTFFGYEGLGSVYWHMVSKLQLAIQEVLIRAIQDASSQSTINRLQVHYCDVREGIGASKPPQEYGAFPFDPYSHTPKHNVVQQPGMTGQVKEDILCRFGELGMRMKQGSVHFDLGIFELNELSRRPFCFKYFDPAGNERECAVGTGGFAYLYCQVPVVYQHGNTEAVTVMWNDGSSEQFPGSQVPESVCREWFGRSGKIKCIQLVSPRISSGARSSSANGHAG